MPSDKLQTSVIVWTPFILRGPRHNLLLMFPHPPSVRVLLLSAHVYAFHLDQRQNIAWVCQTGSWHEAISYDGGARDQLNQSTVEGRSVAKERWKVRERWGLKVSGKKRSRWEGGKHRITLRPQLFIETVHNVVWCNNCEGFVLKDCDKSLLFSWTTHPSKQEVAESETGSRKLLARMMCAHWLWSTSREQQQHLELCVGVSVCVRLYMCVCACKERKRKGQTTD